MRALSLLAFLALFWLLLSGDFTPLRLGMGAVSCVLVAWLARRMRIVDEEGHPIELLGRLLRYLPWLWWQVLLSNLDVALRVWHPRLPISPRLVRVPLATRTAVGVATYANSITLTPGTVTVDVRDGELLVHALSEEAERSLLTGAMHDRVRWVEGQG